MAGITYNEKIVQDTPLIIPAFIVGMCDCNLVCGSNCREVAAAVTASHSIACNASCTNALDSTNVECMHRKSSGAVSSYAAACHKPVGPLTDALTIDRLSSENIFVFLAARCIVRSL
jgi:hypothetical protein